MLGQLFAIARNTFFESIRQPVVLVILVVVTVLLVLANPLSAFTMESDQRMLVDIGMATVFVAGCILAAFVATGVLTREIENRTALTVVSKPVARPVFVIGKFLGVGAALVLATIYMSLVFLIVELHSVIETVRDPVHVPVVVFGVSAVVLGAAIAIWCNYFYGKVFASTAISVTTPLLAVAYLFSLMFDPKFRPQPLAVAFKPDLVLGLFTMLVAILVLTAIAIAASARLGQVMTLAVTLGAFILGLGSDAIVGEGLRKLEAGWMERARAEGKAERHEIVREFTLSSGEVQRSYAPEIVWEPTVPLTTFARGAELAGYYPLKVVYAVIPNFQVMWLSDALTQDRRIPRDYVAMSTLYGSTYVVAALAIGVMLFQRREVG